MIIEKRHEILMIRIEYNSRQIWKRIVVFQGIPIVALLYAIGIGSGTLNVRSLQGLQIALGIGVIMYVLMMAMLLKALLAPLLFAVDDDRQLTWNPYFTAVKRQLPRGTKIEVSHQQLRITPPVPGLPATRTDGEATLFSLPQGLNEVQTQSLVLGGEHS